MSDTPKDDKTPEVEVVVLVKEEGEKKDIKQIVKGGAEFKQKGVLKKAKGIFFGGEFKSASRYVLADVLLPAARDMLFDTVTKGVERVVYGESMSSRRLRDSGVRSNVAYNRPVQRGRSGMLPDQPPHRSRVNRRESNDVLLETRPEADLVLQTMCDIIDKYDVVSMSDLNELIGQRSATVDHKWGWTNLAEANIRQTRQGVLLELPPVEEI